MTRLAALALALALVPSPAGAAAAGGGMPKARAVSAKDRKEIAVALGERFGVKPGADMEVRAAGAFRFAGAKDFLYIDRTDVGSVAFELASYAATGTPLVPDEVGNEKLLPRIDDVLGRSGLRADGREFARFDEEFAGAVPRKDAGGSFDPRSRAKLVGRTAEYRRVIDGVPVFGSELLVGLDQKGMIGRLRLHWPPVDPHLVGRARALGAKVRERRWTLPAAMRGEDIEVIDVEAGVGHSAFADPVMASAAVVRVLYRRTARGTAYPITSTSYRYFDENGREVTFARFPATRGTPAERKAK